MLNHFPLQTKTSSIAFLGRLLLSGVVLSVIHATVAQSLPPSPYDVLRSRDLETPILDAVNFCVPEGLDIAIDPILEQASELAWDLARGMLADWTQDLDRISPPLVVLDAVFSSREAVDREDLSLAEERLRTLLRDETLQGVEICQRLELARILLLLSRESESSAQLTKAQRVVDERSTLADHADQIQFWRAEILYRTHRPFEAHLGYRKLTKSTTARLALAARLRLTDLSFDSGKVGTVSAEYEALLPRASAFGASTTGWALRASEAALEAGEFERGLRWLKSFLENNSSREARATAEIRLADLDVEFDDALRARKRLSTVSGRRAGDPIGALAGIRAIDLGVSEKSAEQRLDVLLAALRDQRRGVRRYALGVLMRELSHRGDLNGALAVATRLAYEGIDPVVTPNYGKDLDALLTRVSSLKPDGNDCQGLVRALGGRYGILIERASKPTPFAHVGGCFEEMELPWLAATVYRTMARRFGALGAQSIALPLARSSLAIGEITLARRVAAAALEEPDDHVEQWKAIVAEADFKEGRTDEAANGLLSILDSPKLVLERSKLVRLLALTLEKRGRIEDARYIAERVPTWLVEREPAPKARANMIEAVMLAAHALRRAEDIPAAIALYRVVDQHAAASALRSSARFWLGLSREADSEGNDSWGDDPNISLGSPWGRFAIFEKHYEPLFQAYAEAIR